MTNGDDIVEFAGLSDRAILREIGRRLRRRRLEKNMSQEKVAVSAGVARATVVKIEKGSPTGVLTLIQILRVLDAIEELDTFLPDPGISPLELAKMKGRERQRASSPRSTQDRREFSW